MKTLKNITTWTTRLLTNESNSNSLTHSPSSQNDAPPYPEPLSTTADDRGEDVKEEDDDDEYDVVEGEDDDSFEETENKEVEVVATAAEEEELITRQNKLANGFFEVESIRKKRIFKGEPLYLIKWVRWDSNSRLLKGRCFIGVVQLQRKLRRSRVDRRGWPESANTWEPVDHLQTCPDVIEAYEESLKSGQKKNSKRKLKFTQQKKKMQYSYGPTKTKVSSSNEHQDPTALDNSPTVHPQPDMVDIVVKHEKATKRRRTPKKIDRIGSPTVAINEKFNFESVQLCGENNNGINSDLQLQNTHVEGDGPSDQKTNSTGVKAGQSNPRRGAQRRKSGSVRRFTQDVTSLNIDCYGTPSPVNASASEGVEQLMVGISDGVSKKRSESSNNVTITKIIKPITFSASGTNNAQDVSVTFVVMRSDGKEITVTNNYLKANYPLLLINFYEQRLRYNPI